MALVLLQVLATTIKSFAECYFQEKFLPTMRGQMNASSFVQAILKEFKSSKKMCCEFHGMV